MKRYSMIKNIYLASATAALYYGWIVDSVTPAKKIIATLAVFVAMFLIMRDTDKQFLHESPSDWARRRERRHEKKTS